MQAPHLQSTETEEPAFSSFWTAEEEAGSFQGIEKIYDSHFQTAAFKEIQTKQILHLTKI